jgi:putative mRNA 3-end processing factor
MESDPILSVFPRSLDVLGKKIGELPPQTIDTAIMEKIPSEFIQPWLPKYVYSKPEITQKIRIYFPGGDGIGHSAIIIKTNEGVMLFDFGLSVVNSTSPRWLPLLEKIDAVFLSHAHLDHSGSFPILYQNNRKLPWFATKPTRILSEMLWHDTSNILKRNYPSSFFEKETNLKNLGAESNILNVMKNYNEIKLNSPISVLPQVEVTAHSAGHLFGSTGFEINIAGKRLLYTGDFNTKGTQMLKGASFDTEVDLAIFDGTYYGRHESRPDPIEELKKVFDKSDRVLIPAFSVGRSQEILYTLKKLGVDKSWNIYLTGMAGRVAKNLNLVFSDPKKDVGVIPFSSIRTMNGDEFKEKSVVIGGQGMLAAGTSRKLLEYTAEDPKTSVVLCGYQAPNTLGYWLDNKHPYLVSKFSQRVYNISLSGDNLTEFIDNVKGKKVMVHAPKGAYQSQTRKDVLLPTEVDPFPFT